MEAKNLAESGEIPFNDPRAIYAGRGASLSVPKNSNDYRSIWQEVIDSDSPPELKATLLVARKVVGKGTDAPVSARDLAVCLESAAVRLAACQSATTGDLKPADLIERAALVCDSAVLIDRHRSESRLVAPVAEASAIPPQRVLSGMMRLGLIDQNDHRVKSFIEGHLGEFNQMDRTEFFKSSAVQIKLAMGEFPKLPSSELEKKDVAQSIVRLSAANSGKADSVVKEADVLSATAGLAESFSNLYAKSDPERAKTLAAISMSSTSRSHLIKEQYPDKFIGAGLRSIAREDNQQE